MKEAEKERRTFCDLVEDLDSYTHTAITTSNYTREQRYVLCAEISRIVDEIFTLAIRCKKGYVQKSTLQYLFLKRGDMSNGKQNSIISV